MKSHHLRTVERDPYDPFGVECFTLDSLLIPDASIFMGYVQTDKRKGLVVCYPYPSLYSDRAWALANGDESIRGEVIAVIDLFDEVVERLKKRYDPYLQYSEKVYHILEHIELDTDFDGSTHQLIMILTGQNYEPPGGGKHKRIPSPSLRPIPLLNPLQP